MNKYPYFEERKELLGLDDIPTDELIKEGSMKEETIASYDRKLKDTLKFQTCFPIGYAYEENRTVHYRIRFSEFFQLLRELPAASSLLDFVAQDTGNTVDRLKQMVEKIMALIVSHSTEQDDVVTLNMEDIISTALETVIGPLYQDNFFLFLTACAFLHYYIELSVYSFYPYAALDNYEKILGTSFDRECEEYAQLENSMNDGMYDISAFLEIGIRYTADFLDKEKEQLSHDLSILAGTQDVMVDNTILQKLYLLESQKKLQSGYLDTNFNVHLMPVGIHKSDHRSIVEKIVLENMEVREVYDINSIHDWYRYEFISLIKGDILFKKCQCCGRFFIPSGRSDSEYCDRINVEYGKPCKEIGATLAFAKRHENDEIHQAYTKAYRRMDSRKRTHYISKKEFTEWSKTARQKRTACQNGEITLEEFQAWLDESKCR
jgi:hypothetical protein